MKKSIVIASMLLGSSLFALDIKPYAGLAYHNFSITSDKIVLTNKSTGASTTNTADTKDSGTTTGLVGGAIINDSSKVNVFYLSGKEDDSKLITVTSIGISYDYNFNNHGTHQGWILGAGIVNTKFEFDALSGKFDSYSGSSTGLTFKFGYEYLINDTLLLEASYNYLGSVEGMKTDYTANTNYEWDTDLAASTIAFSASYVF